MITSSFNAGVDAAVISMTLKHSNLDQLRRYATPDASTMMKSAMAIGKANSESKNDSDDNDSFDRNVIDENSSSNKRRKFESSNNGQESTEKINIFYFQF